MAIDTEAIKVHVRGILEALGDDPDREGLKETPDRVARMYEEVFEGMNYTNHEIAQMFNKTFTDRMEFGSASRDMVIVRDIDIFSYCEHHLALMYDMKVTVAYIPKEKVIGLSKIARIADMVAKRLQLQEQITIGVIQYDVRDIDKSFKALHEQGFGSCELNYSEKRFTKELAEQVKAASEKHRIRVTTLVGVPGSKSTWNFRQGPATIGLVPIDERFEKLDLYRKMIDFCVQAGIPAMHSHFGFIPEDPSSAQYKDFIEVMRGLATYAKERNVLIYFETGQETPITLIRAIRDIGTGNLFINCDLANLLMYGKSNSLDAVKLFGNLIKEFHAKDGKYPDPNNPYELGHEVPIPTGDVDFPAVIAELKKQGFKGAITIECELNGTRHDYVIQTRKYLQELLDR